MLTTTRRSGALTNRKRLICDILVCIPLALLALTVLGAIIVGPLLGHFEPLIGAIVTAILGGIFYGTVRYIERR